MSITLYVCVGTVKTVSIRFQPETTMKIKNNWLDHHVYGVKGNGNFEKNGADKNSKRSNTEFYIIKKEKKAMENFSSLLLNEFTGTRIPVDQLEVQRLPDEKQLISNVESKAIHFLNGYWA